MANAKEDDVEGGKTSTELCAHEVIRRDAQFGSLRLVPYVAGPGANLERHSGGRSQEWMPKVRSLAFLLALVTNVNLVSC